MQLKLNKVWAIKLYALRNERFQSLSIIHVEMDRASTRSPSAVSGTLQIASNVGKHRSFASPNSEVQFLTHSAHAPKVEWFLDTHHNAR